MAVLDALIPTLATAQIWENGPQISAAETSLDIQLKDWDKAAITAARYNKGSNSNNS